MIPKNELLEKLDRILEIERIKRNQPKIKESQKIAEKEMFNF